MLKQHVKTLESSNSVSLRNPGTKDLILQNLAVATIYFAVAGLSLFFAFENTRISPIWPSAGLALAAVLLRGYSVGPGIFIGALAANIFTLDLIGAPGSHLLVAALSTAVGNTLEALLGAFLLHRFAGTGYVFRNVRSTLVFMGVGALLSTAIGALIGVSGLLFAIGQWDLYGSAWFTWWLGDATGIILCAPLFLSWSQREHIRITAGFLAETAAFLILLSAITVIVYLYNFHLAFLMFPILLWAIFRFDFFSTTLSVGLVTAIALYGATRTGNPIMGQTLSKSLLLIQCHIGVLALSAQFLSVVVTEKRRSGRAVRMEKAFTDSIIDSVPGAFYVLDHEGHLVRWNRLLEELNDLSSEELAGMNSLRNIHTDDKNNLLRKICDAFETGEAEVEGRIFSRGKIRHYLFTGRRIDIAGTPYVVGTGIDMTDRKNAELEVSEYQKTLESRVAERTEELSKLNAALASEIEERRALEKVLLESEAKYRDLVEGANSVILRWDRDGKIIFFNRFAQEFFGYSEVEILGQNIIGTIVPARESTGRILESLAKNIRESPDAYVFNENENIKKNGERVWVAWTNRVITDMTGRITEVLSVGNDITRRKIAEDRLKITLEELAAARDRAEAADRLKSAFLATMSHELRTPLNSIIGFTGIMLGGYVGPLNDEQTKQLGMVRNSANHLLALINDVLDISKIEAGQLQVSLEPFSLMELVNQTIASSRPALDKKGLCLLLNASGGIDIVSSDRRRVEQILLNLLSNAIKFTDTGEIRVTCVPVDGTIEVSVIDSGIGIREGDIDKLFKAFQQVDAGTTRRYEGTGLGLYICKKLLDLLGGKIRVTSTWGAGSTFCFTLPLDREPS